MSGNPRHRRHLIVRLVVRILVGLVSLLVGLLLVVLVASFVFNLSTDGGSKPVTALWQGKFVQAGPVLTAYRRWGDRGTPIVLIGGFVEPSFVWEKVGPLLARGGHRVYALDLDGFGYTKRHGPWTLQGWSDQTAAFMRALGVRNPVIVGHSLGAAVAVEIARRGLASRAVLVDGDALVLGGPSSFFRGLIASSPLVTSVVRIALRWDWPVEQVLREAYGPRHPKIDHALVARWTDPFRAAGAESAMNHIVDHGAQGFKLADLATPAIRATVIWGSKDTVVPPASGEKVARVLHARFVTILGAGHLSLLSHPRRVAAEILRDA